MAQSLRENSNKSKHVNLEKEIQDLRKILAEKEKMFLERRRIVSDEIQSNMDTNKYNKHLTSREITRYSRQIFLMQNHKLQVLLKSKSVLLVGCGSLGCVCALYLVGAGVGNLTIVDNGYVNTVHLHGHIIHNEEDVGKAIANSVYDHLRR